MSHSRKRKEGIEHKRRASSSSSGVSSGSNSSRSSISSVNIENLTAHLKDVEDALIAENAAERRRQIHAEITGSQEVDTLVFLSTKDKLEEDEMNQAKGILNTIINHKQKDTSNTNMVMLDLLKTALIQLLKYHFPELTSASNNNKFKEKIISLTEEQLISIIADITRYISFNTLKILKEVTDSNKILAHKVITGFLIYKGEIELFLDISKKCNDFINRYNIKEKEIHKLTDEELNDILNSISTDALNDFIQQLRAIPPLKQSAELNETWLNYAIRARETRFPLKKDIISIHEISEKTEEVLKELNIAVENVRTKRQYIERFGLTEAVSYLLSSVDKYLSQKLTVLGEEGDAETIKKGYMNCLNNFNREINYIIEKSEDENTKKTIKHAYRNFLNCIDVLINEERDRIATQKRGTLNITDIPIATGMLTDIQKSIDNAQNIEEYKDNLKLDEFKSQSSMANAIISLAEKYLNMIPKKKAVKGEVGYEEEEIRYTEFVKSLNNAKATALKRLEEGKKPYEKDENPQTWNTKAQIESRYEEEFDRIKRKEEEEKRKAEEAQRKAEEKERKEAERRAKEEAKAIKAKEAKERKEQYELMMKGVRGKTGPHTRKVGALGAKGLTKGERNAMEAERLANIKKRRAEYQREEGDVVGETRNIFESRIHEEGKGKEMQTTRMTPFKGYHLIADVEKRAIPNPNFGPTGKYIMKPVPEPTPERILNLNEEAVKFFDWLAKQPWVFANLSAGKVIKKKEEGAIRKFISDAITALSSTEDKQVKYNQLKNQNKDTVTKIYKNIGEEYKTKPGSKPKQAYNTLLPEGLIDNNIARAILDSHAEENLSQEHIKQLTSELKELLTVKTRGGALKTKQNKQFTKLNKKIKTKKAGKH